MEIEKTGDFGEKTIQNSKADSDINSLSPFNSSAPYSASLGTSTDQEHQENYSSQTALVGNNLNPILSMNSVGGVSNADSIPAVLGDNKLNSSEGVALAPPTDTGNPQLVNLPPQRAASTSSLHQYTNGSAFPPSALLSGSGTMSSGTMHLSSSQTLKPNPQQVFQTLLSGETSLINSGDIKNSNSNNSNGGLHPVGSSGNLVSDGKALDGSGAGGLSMSRASPVAGSETDNKLFLGGQMYLSSLGQPQVGSNGDLLLQGNQGRPNPQSLTPPLPMARASSLGSTSSNPQSQTGVSNFSNQKARSWHDPNNDSSTRAAITENIKGLLQARKTTTTTADFQTKLPQMALRLERELYNQALSFAEYSDPRTLKHRLQALATRMANPRAPPSSDVAPSNGQVAPLPMRPVTTPTAAVNNGKPPIPLMVGGGPVVKPSGVPSAPPAAPVSAASTTGPARQFINISQINSLLASQPPAPIQPSSAPAVKTENKPAAVFDAAQGNPASQQSLDSHSEESRKQQVLKQQQQRLLLLRHASKCPNDSKCHVTPHCAGMKLLWKHIMSCRDQDCKTSHCVSSRYVLSHYSKCKDQNCPVCAPVREAIRRNREKTQPVFDIARSQHAGAPAPSSKNASSMNAPEGAPAPKGKAGKLKGEGTKKGKKALANAAAGSAGGVAPPATAGKLSLRLPASSMEISKGAADNPLHGDTLLRNPPPISPSAPVNVSLDKLDNLSCAIYSFTDAQLLDHIRHLQEGLRMTAATVKEKMLPIVNGFLDHPNGYIFGHPVDPVALNIPDYFTIIKFPMDLGTIKKRLENGVYRDWEDVAQDIRTTFDNAMLYNAKTDDVHGLAKQFKREFETKYKSMLMKLDQEIELAKESKDNCNLCGEYILKFDPPVYYCNGRRCSCQRIRRGSNYYIGGNNAYHWCQPCYNELKDNQPIKLADMTLQKKDLQKKKHTEEFDEPWVHCDMCDRWVHMVCALFNNRRNISEKMPFICPICILKERRTLTSENPIIPEKKTQAVDLPHCKMSAFIEKRVMERLSQAYSERASLLGIPVEELEKCPNISIRQVSSVDKIHRTREGMLARYGCKDYPAEFPCRSKCIVLFQNLDGQDVMLFGMYVYEYDHKCPQPNQRRVYISYLDSVHYFRPRQYRTIVYHEILVAYLEYVKLRGFHTAHIWACPPLKGDDYIMYCHPPDQKTPKDDRLRLWYVQMLDICKKRGIVLETIDIYNEYLADASKDATVLPYFEGDYWVGEAENIIKGLGRKALGLGEDLGDVDDNMVDEKSKNKSKSKKRERTATRFSAAATGHRDVVMTKLAGIIEPMKEAFFVAKLHSDEFARACAELREKELIEINGGAEAPKKRMRSNLSSLDVNSMASRNASAPIPGKVNERETTLAGFSAPVIAANPVGASSQNFGEGVAHSDNTVPRAPDAMSVDEGVVAESKEAVEEEGAVPAAVEMVIDASVVKTEGSSEVLKKMLPNGKFERAVEVDEDALVGSELGVRTESVGEIVIIDTEDVDDTQECEHFETRQAFLNLCQGNHYQFDQLRRSKLTSLMVLYHLHNPDAPKFISNCANPSCKESILTGYRYQCETCDVDYCQRCYSFHGSKIHPAHPLRPVPVGGNVQQSQLTAEQLRERQRNIQTHLEVLQHAALCNIPDCKTRNCSKMKEFLEHVSKCPTKAEKGCIQCKRISKLLALHARVCRNDGCGVPYCQEMRSKIRELSMRQQEMDDRRRQMMNEMYSRPGGRSDDA